jgi:hypothetical protein
MEVTVIQAALLMAVQEQPLPAVTATLPAPPLAGKEASVGLRAKAQEPSWATDLDRACSYVEAKSRNLVHRRSALPVNRYLGGSPIRKQ